MYNDNLAKDYSSICDYLKIPYGFYFIEESKNNDEILQEAHFISDLISDINPTFNVLPLAIDMENQHGKGRTDNMWEGRTSLINTLIDELKKISKSIKENYG